MGSPERGIGWIEGAFGGFLAFGDAPYTEEPDDMIDAIDVEEPFGNFEPQFPPGKVGLAHGVPIEERKSPILAELIVVVGRRAGSDVEMEEVGIGPDVGAVGADKDRNVANEEDALFCGVGVDLGELLKRVVLGGDVGFELKGGERGEGRGPIGPVFVLEAGFVSFELGVGEEPGILVEEGLGWRCVGMGGEVTGVEGAGGDGVVGAGIGAAVVEGKKLDAVEAEGVAPINEGDEVEEGGGAIFGVNGEEGEADAVMGAVADGLPVGLHLSPKGLLEGRAEGGADWPLAMAFIQLSAISRSAPMRPARRSPLRIWIGYFWKRTR